MLYGFIIILAQVYWWGMGIFSQTSKWINKNIHLIFILALGFVATLFFLN